MNQAATRRTVLRLLAGAPLLLAGAPHTLAADLRKIERLIKDAKAYPKISERIDFISRALLGTRYVAHTLIGGPRRDEQFVLRDDAFDCVTYCEVVLAAAIGRDLGEFETALKKIRYHNGVVSWRERNHYWADWCQRNVDNKLCRPVMIGEPVKVTKDVNSEPAVGRRQFILEAIPRLTLLAGAKQLATGDIIGFVSRRPTLDYFHTGFVAFGRNGELLLRNASASNGRVLDQTMAQFFATNGTQFVTVLRPQETATTGVAKSAS